MIKKKTLRLAVACVFALLAFVAFQAEEAAAGFGDCWFCISYDLCKQSPLGSEGCTVVAGGHGCQYQCQEIGDPCFPGGGW
ncbi:MAG: hypothetical protein AAGD01_10000 [Acidobacteriota bacterium]